MNKLGVLATSGGVALVSGLAALFGAAADTPDGGAEANNAQPAVNAPANDARAYERLQALPQTDATALVRAAEAFLAAHAASDYRDAVQHMRADALARLPMRVAIGEIAVDLSAHPEWLSLVHNPGVTFRLTLALGGQAFLTTIPARVGVGYHEQDNAAIVGFEGPTATATISRALVQSTVTWQLSLTALDTQSHAERAVLRLNVTPPDARAAEPQARVAATVEGGIGVDPDNGEAVPFVLAGADSAGRSIARLSLTLAVVLDG